MENFSHGVARALFVRPRTRRFLTWWKISSNLDSALTFPAYLSLIQWCIEPPVAPGANLRNLTLGVLERGGPSIGTVQFVRNRRQSRQFRLLRTSLAYFRIFTIHFQLLQVNEPFAMDFFSRLGQLQNILCEKITFHGKFDNSWLDNSAMPIAIVWKCAN